MSIDAAPNVLPAAHRLGSYAIQDELGHGAMSVVYRATRDDHAYAIKLMAANAAVDAVDMHLQFRREAAAIARLDHPSLVRVVEVGESDGRPYLVMDLAEGESLDRRITRQLLTDVEVTVLARALSEALVEVHRFGLVHRDIKPANIVISPAGAAKLIDFGLVTGKADPEAVVGTLHYAAPEQLGVLKRAVGAPADLYSLGATLFECLTGAPPLQAESQRDFLHHLAAVRAPDLREVRPGTRPALAVVIAKLLAKDPDDRYQSARGLLADLDLLDRIDDALLAGLEPSLGAQDAHASTDGETPLVGRREELSRLHRDWRSALRGEATFVQVEGEGGSGKTRLVRELVTTVAGQGALVLSGKCQELETVPFGPLREAADQYAARVLRMPPAEREEAITRVRKAAGDRAPLVKRLSVGLARILGDVVEMRALEPDAEQQRYYEAIASFFRNLASAAVPLVLVIDDVQWLDEGSLRVLGRLAAGGNSGHILVVSTSRNNAEAEAAGARYVETIGSQLAERIELKPLRLKAVNELITALLGGRSLAQPAVEKLAALTNGNPFAVGEYLRALLDGGVIRLVDGRWTADPAALEAAKLPKDVVELVVSRLFSLGDDSSMLVGVAALIGGRFSLDLLARVAKLGLEAVARSIEELVRTGLVERTAAGEYSFLHDRVREAAVERLSADRRKDLHQAIAEALEVVSDPSPNHLYALARHYAHGHVDKDPRRVAETNLAAGLRALEDHANEEAFELLDRALVISKATGEHSDAMRLLEGLGRACAMTGRLERAFDHLEEALRLATRRTDQFRIQYLLTLTYASQGRNDDALQALLQAFRVIGRPFPTSIVMQVLSLCWFWLLALGLRTVGYGYGRASGEDRERRQVLSQLHYAGTMIALFQGRPVLMVQFVVRDFLNVHFLGPTAETAIAYSVYGAVLGTFQLRNVMERYARLGIEIAQQIGDAAALSICRAYHAVGTKWAGELVRGNEMLVEALPDLHRNVPGSWYAAMMICEQAYSYLHGGLSTEAIEHVRANATQLERTNNLMFRYNTRSVLCAEMMVSGEMAEATALWTTLEEQYKPLAKTIYVGLAHVIATLEVMIDQEETGKEVDDAIDAFQGLLSEDYYSNAARMLAGYARLGQFLAAKDEAERKRTRANLEKAIRGIALRAMVPVFKCHALILKAVLARVDGDTDRARKLLDRADRLVARCQSRRGAYYVAVERARLARALGDPTSTFFAQVALEVARSQRWRQKSRRIRAEFGLDEDKTGVRQRMAATSMTVGNTASMMTRTADQTRRYADALLQVSLASASTLDPAIQAKNALGEVSRVLGAERALFFLVDPASGELVLEASVGVDSGGEHISKTVVRRVMDTRAPIVLTGTDSGESLGSQSIVAYGLRSIMAAPIMLRDRLMGVVYLDSRLAKGMFTEDDVSLLLGVSNHIAIAIETARTARLEAERSALQRDFELLGAVQSLLLPKSRTFAREGLRGSGFYQPAAKCGGDWWWQEVQEDGCLFLVLGDVSGHGAGPAMISSAISGAFHTMRSLKKDADPREILEEVDRRVRSFGGGFQMTMSIVRIDPKKHELSWWNAAAPVLFVLHAGDCTPIALRGHVLGDSSPFEVGTVTVPFVPGDRLLMCTDGVLELKRPDGRELGARRVSQMFSRLARTSVEDLPACLGEELNASIAGRPQDDDITFIVVEATESEVPA